MRHHTVAVQMCYVVLLPRRWCPRHRGVGVVVVEPRHVNLPWQGEFRIFAFVIERQTEDCNRYLRALRTR
jgi:hypothetical protein